MRRLLLGATALVVVLAGCGGSGDPDPDPERIGRGLEERFAVEDARCHPVRGGDGNHFYCLVDVGRGQEFKLGVAVVAGKEEPVLTDCEGAGEKREPNTATLCALHEVGSG